MKEFLEWIRGLILALIIAFIIINYIIINAVIPSGSMKNTINEGDRVFGTRFAYYFQDPKRGDVIVFKYPEDEKILFIKRVIALPGETIEVKNGNVYINHSKTPLKEPYIKEKANKDFGPYKVPKNCYFVMGDNRNDSYDARYWKQHYVKKDKILGKAGLKYYPNIQRIK